MNGKIGGQRPRPRVALLGSFEPDDMEHFEHMFPTIWLAKNIVDLEDMVDVREIDLMIIAKGIEYIGDWLNTTHGICFSDLIDNLPGPTSNTYLEITSTAETEEYLFPDVPLPISRRRGADFNDLDSVRRWPRISLTYSQIETTKLATAKAIFNRSGIICELQTNSPLAIYFLREDTNLGVGWFPSLDKNLSAWVELLVTEWAQTDKDAFPYFRDWTESREWMVAEEEEILSKIEDLKKKKQETVNKIDKQISELSTSLATAKLNANKGRRRLITAQGPELVDEVMKALNEIGFKVMPVDDQIADNKRKREDLRLSHSGKMGEKWNAIVEVRGYARSAGKTDDLQRLGQFAKLYQKETGQFPDKLIYIVNGQLELTQPSQRQEPLAPQPDDLEVFSDSDGILIWSIDLFRALKTTEHTDYPALIESIKCAQGRWVSVDVSSPKEN